MAEIVMRDVKVFYDHVDIIFAWKHYISDKSFEV